MRINYKNGTEKTIEDYFFRIEEPRMQEGELKRCPFCNSSNIEKYPATKRIGCARCGATVPGETETEATLKWNVRMGR